MFLKCRVLRLDRGTQEMLFISVMPMNSHVQMGRVLSTLSYSKLGVGIRAQGLGLICNDCDIGIQDGASILEGFKRLRLGPRC